MKALILK